MFFVICSIFLIRQCASDMTCSKIPNLEQVTKNERLQNSTFLELVDKSLLRCVQYCFQSAACQSFNFQQSYGFCELNFKSRIDSSIEVAQNFVTSDIILWPERLAGPCWNHNCPNNTLCDSTDSLGFKCVVIGCTNDSIFINSVPSYQFPFWSTGHEVPRERVCETGFYPSNPVICQSNGTWSNFQCIPYPSSCIEVQQCSSAYGDDEYWIFPEGRSKVKLYCYGMDTSSPEEFITLHFPNSAEKSYYVYENHSSCSVVKANDTYITDNNMGKSIFHKVKLTLHNLKIYRQDHTFANSSYLAYAYGSARDCATPASSPCPVLGKMVMDFRLTSFYIDSIRSSWALTSSATSVEQNVTYSSNRQTFSMNCGGDCGGCFFNNIQMEINEIYEPETNSAVLPQCV
ncbi:hypothetical protein SNE40_014611 [Patella caerulea]|uniref:GON domain-containing protein n=1 Tax=Patella caerulea TaxID=87958 RepID=A0AAN8JH91_PATCE